MNRFRAIGRYMAARVAEGKGPGGRSVTVVWVRMDLGLGRPEWVAVGEVRP